MRVIRTVVEIEEYMICNHLDAYTLFPMSGEENRGRPPLRCDILPLFFDQRRKDDDEWCGTLIRSLESAFRGKDPKWILVSVTLSREEGVVFDFCDSTTSVDEKDYKQRLRSVHFPNFKGFFKIEADYLGNDYPDEYFVKFGMSDEEEDDNDKSEMEEIFSVNIQRNNECFTQEIIKLHTDGKCYLHQLKYD